jgi:hypothetical protein
MGLFFTFCAEADAIWLASLTSSGREFDMIASEAAWRRRGKRNEKGNSAKDAVSCKGGAAKSGLKNVLPSLAHDKKYASKKKVTKKQDRQQNPVRKRGGEVVLDEILGTKMSHVSGIERKERKRKKGPKQGRRREEKRKDRKEEAGNGGG